jgi:hypothetical protein
MTNLEYNTQHPNILLKEYGRNLQNLANYITKIDNREERTRLANHLIALMREINPETRESDDVEKKLWDDLYIMSDFKLEVDSPFPLPEANAIGKKPQPLGYKYSEVKLRYYGKNIQLLVQKAFTAESDEEKFNQLTEIGKLMKRFYSDSNKEGITTDILFEHLEYIAGQKISDQLKDRFVNEKAFDNYLKEKKESNNNNKRKDLNKNQEKNKRKNSKFNSASKTNSNTNEKRSNNNNNQRRK